MFSRNKGSSSLFLEVLLFFAVIIALVFFTLYFYQQAQSKVKASEINDYIQAVILSIDKLGNSGGAYDDVNITPNNILEGMPGVPAPFEVKLKSYDGQPLTYKVVFSGHLKEKNCEEIIKNLQTVVKIAGASTQPRCWSDGFSFMYDSSK